MAHVINLVVQAFLAAMEEAGDPDNDDNYESTKAHPLFYNADDDTNQLDHEFDLEEIESASMQPVGISEDDESEMADALAQSSALKRVRLSHYPLLKSYP